jgi:hypothetical protein
MKTFKTRVDALMLPASPEHRAPPPQQSAVAMTDSSATISNCDGTRRRHREAAIGTGGSLLTPRDILSRLGMTSADPAKWMRRTFTKLGVPYVHACGKTRATEAQYQLLLEKITCSPSAPVGKTVFITSVERSRSATSGSRSKSSVQERVTQMLHRT